MKKLLIINYHSLFHPGLKGNQHFDTIYTTYLADFMQQMLILKNSNIPIINLDQLNTFEGDKAIAITFDDGHVSDYKLAYPILMENELTASFFPTFLNVKPDSERWEEYREMVKNGFCVGSHGLSHQYLNDLTDEEQFIELKGSKERIQDLIQTDIKAFSLPGGKMNDRTLEIALSAGYDKLLNTQFGLNDLSKSSAILKRWNVKRTTSIQMFKEIASLDSSIYRWKTIKSAVFEKMNRWIGNYHADRLNYYLHKL